MEIPIHGLMYRVDSALDIVEGPPKDSASKPTILWPDDVLEEATIASEYTGPDARLLGSYPKSGIDVLIVGTGFGGLTAALECTRKGHNVRILERNSTTDLAGKMNNILCA